MGSVGLFPEQLPFSSTNRTIAHFRHAIALDEHRVKFIPSLYGRLYHPHQPPCEPEGKADSITTSVKEVFFAGAHCGTLPAFKRVANTLLMGVLSDVGGGAVPNGRRHSLARIPLRWMIRECFNAKTGIIFDAHMLKHQVGLDIDSDTALGAPQPILHPTDYWTKAEPDGRFSLRWILGPQKSISNPDESDFKDEPTEELHDVLSPIYDQLKKHTFWKVMEWIPCEPSSSLKPFAPMTTSSKPSGRNTPSKSLGRKIPLKSLGRKTPSKSLGRQSPSWMIQMPYGAPRSCRFPPCVVYR